MDQIDNTEERPKKECKMIKSPLTWKIEYAIKCCQSMFFAEALWRFCGLDFSVWTFWAVPFNAVAVRV